jgi:hypothetical protein
MMANPSTSQELFADSPIAVCKPDFAVTDGFVLGRRDLDNDARVVDAPRGIGREADRLDTSFNRAFDHFQESDWVIRILIVHWLDQMNVLEVRLNSKVRRR